MRVIFPSVTTMVGIGAPLICAPFVAACAAVGGGGGDAASAATAAGTRL